MAVNLIEMLASQLGGSQYAQIGKFLGADEGSVKTAMGAALPSILGSVINNGSSASGAAGIMNMLTKGNFDGSMLNNLGGLFGGGNATTSMMNSGSSILTSLLGNKMGGVVDMIGSLSGLKKGASSSLMSMAAPLVMSMIGRYVKDKALDAVGLSNFLGTQKKHVASALPTGMGSLLGFSAGDLGDSAKSTVDSGSKMMAEAADTGGSIFSKILPLLLIAVLAGGAYWFFTGNRPDNALSDATSGISEAAGEMADKAGDMANNAANSVKEGAAATADAAGDMADKAGNAIKDGAEATADAAGDMADAAGDMAENAMDATTKAARAAMANIKFAAGSVGEKFSTAMATGKASTEAFMFNNMNFAVGKATIDAGSYTEVDNLAAVLKAYPNVKIAVSGHTDNTGNAASNKTLSQARAEAVKARLVAQGVDASRISAVGFGADKPVASNDTTEGKAQNRRIEVRITER